MADRAYDGLVEADAGVGTRRTNFLAAAGTGVPVGDEAVAAAAERGAEVEMDRTGEATARRKSIERCISRMISDEADEVLGVRQGSRRDKRRGGVI